LIGVMCQNRALYDTFVTFSMMIRCVLRCPYPDDFKNLVETFLS